VSNPKAIASEKPLVRELRPRAQKLCRLKGWTFVAPLGAGATAAVYEVVVGNRPRALKIYSPRFLKGRDGPLVQKRLKLVLDTLANHDCEHLVQIYEGGEAEGISYMLMQRAPGACLGDMLNLVPPSKIRDIVRQVALAAKFLEDRQLCHRDIKVDNIAISDDFSKAVLLDLGVVRWLDEDGALGTDHDGSLPFVATARYSSPEYMFRLSAPGPELWRGLTFYQMGGVLHDLIAKERMFEDVIVHARDNRYLIAYAVAARIPRLENDGSIPVDLVILAQRALEKNLSRRLASVAWPNFLDRDERDREKIILGLRPDQTAFQSPIVSPVPQLARLLEMEIDRMLSEGGIHCRHQTVPLRVDAAEINLRWRPPALQSGCEIEVKVTLKGERVLEVAGCALVQKGLDTLARTEDMPIVSLPVASDDQLPTGLVDQVHDSFFKLSARAVSSFLNATETRE
jgi:serine/threonine protein kinase